MRHLVAGRKLGRNASHRKAMFRNMAVSLIKTVRVEEGVTGQAKVPGRIITTVPKAKELRPFVEKLVTMARRAAKYSADAAQFGTTAERGTEAWKQWRDSEQGKNWVKANAPALALKRRAFSELRDTGAVDILFSELAEKFATRNGGYTRIVRLSKVRLGDAAQRAMIEFVGQNDRQKSKKRSGPAVE